MTLPRLHLQLGRRRIGSWRACGWMGALAATALVVALAAARGSTASALIVTAASVASFLVGVKVSVILFGRERIVFYEQALAALGASALALRATGRPLADGIDLCAIGLFAFLAFGRIGCHSVGCCHGLPWRRGVRYGDDHARAGFPTGLVSVPLFPVQLVEASLALALASAGTVLALAPHRGGEVAAMLFAGYGAARTLIELLRGDDARPSWLGLSEAQWTALAVAWVTAWLARGALAFVRTYLALAVALALVDVALVVARRRLAWTRWGLSQGDHLAALAASVRAALAARDLQVFTTRRGARVSVTVDDGVHHFGLSRADRPLTDGEAAALAGCICRLVGARDASLRTGATPGVYHLFLRPE